MAGLPGAGAAPALQALQGPAAEHARIIAFWTPERRAAAQPRDLVLDENGRAYLKLANGTLQPYGRALADGSAPMAKPGGGGGGGGGDTQPPAISDMSPAAGATIGAGATFSATVTDASGLRSVSFKIQKGTSRAQSFSPTQSGDTWSVSLSGFSDGGWSWVVEAKDKAGLTATSAPVAFTVDTSAGGGGGGGGSGTDSVANDPWTAGGPIQTAAGRIYFEMPTNARRTRWAGYVCSGTVVNDGVGDRSVILTAAHCVYDDANKAFARNVMFIPNQDGTTGAGTDRNCSNDPIGCWTTSFGVVDPDWTTRTFPDNIPWDYAFYVVANSGAYTAGLASTNEALDLAAGSMTVSFDAPAVNDNTVGASSGDFTYGLGYSYSDDPNFMYCADDMTTQGTANWWLPICGLSGGSSGGPWEQASTGGAEVVMSVNSWGYSNGSPGMAGPKLNGGASNAASCLFGIATSTGFGEIPAGDGNAGVAPAGC